MIIGRFREDKAFLTSEEILSATNGGYDIYRFYIGRVSRVMKRPWGRDDKPSWGVFPIGGRWIWKDLASEETGNAIQLVQKMFNLSFIEAKDRVVADLGLQNHGGSLQVNRAVVTWDSPTEEEKNYMHISFSSQPFRDYHHQFWNVAHVTEDHCRRYECWAVKDLAINHRKVYIKFREPVFAYYCPEEDGVKVYFPHRGQDEQHPKFKNNVSRDYLWNYSRLQAGGPYPKGILQKSYKDLLVTTLITPNVIASQNEQVKMFIEGNTTERINCLFDHTWVAYGSDPDGVKKSHKISVVTGWDWVNPPHRLLPNVNDFFGLAAESRDGLKAVERLLHEKNYL